VVKDREALAAVIREVEVERVTEVAARVGA
jgi:hypothetical protein